MNQGVSDLIDGVIKNTGTKIAFRLPHADDRAALASGMNLNDAQARDLAVLPQRTAVITTDIDPHACCVAIS